MYMYKCVYIVYAHGYNILLLNLNNFFAVTNQRHLDLSVKIIVNFASMMIIDELRLIDSRKKNKSSILSARARYPSRVIYSGT